MKIRDLVNWELVTSPRFIVIRGGCKIGYTLYVHPEVNKQVVADMNKANDRRIWEEIVAGVRRWETCGRFEPKY